MALNKWSDNIAASALQGNYDGYIQSSLLQLRLTGPIGASAQNGLAVYNIKENTTYKVRLMMDTRFRVAACSSIAMNTVMENYYRGAADKNDTTAANALKEAEITSQAGQVYLPVFYWASGSGKAWADVYATLEVCEQITGSLEITPPAKTTYTVGEVWDPAGMEVAVAWSDGSREAVTDYTVSGFDSEAAGTKTVTVMYQGETAGFEVVVEAAAGNIVTENIGSPNLEDVVASLDLDTGVLTIRGTGATKDFYDTANIDEMKSGLFPDYQRNIKKIVIEEGITYLGGGAFIGMGVNFDTGIQIQEENAVDEIILPDSLTAMGEAALYYIYAKKKVVIGSGYVKGNSEFEIMGIFTPLMIVNQSTEDSPYFRPYSAEGIGLCAGVLYNDYYFDEEARLIYSDCEGGLAVKNIAVISTREETYHLEVPESYNGKPIVEFGAWGSGYMPPIASIEVTLPASVKKVRSAILYLSMVRKFFGVTGTTTLNIHNQESEVTAYDLNGLTEVTWSEYASITGATVNWLKPPVIKVESIEITQKKSRYKKGSDFDRVDLEVTAVFTDGITEIVDSYTLTGFDSTEIGTKTLTVTYGGCSATIDVAIYDLASIEIKPPTKTTYSLYELLDTTGMVVTVVYTDGYTAVVTDYSLSGFDSTSSGTKRITVTYEGKSVSFEVTVEEDANVVVENVGSPALSNVVAALNTKTGILTLQGTGNTKDFTNANGPVLKAYKDQVKQVIISEGITSIGNYLFCRMGNLERVSIPAGITSVGKYAFYYCENLKKNIKLPDVTAIGNYAFYKTDINNEYYSRMVIGKKIATIGNYAFGTAGSCRYYIQKSEGAVSGSYWGGYSGSFFWVGEDSVLDETTGFFFIERETEVELVGDYDRKDNIVIPDTFHEKPVTIIDKKVFAARWPESIMLGANIRELRSNSMPGVSIVKLPESVEIIAADAFTTSTKLVIVPKTEGSIANAPWGAKIIVWSDTEILNGIIYKDYDTYSAVYAFYDESGLIISPEVSFDHNGKPVTVIATGSFSENPTITSVILPDTIERIESNAFSGCSKLAKVNRPESLKLLGGSAFYNTSIEEFDLSGLTKLEYSTFGYTALKKVVIPSSVKTMEYGNFAGCQQLTEVIFEEGLQSIGYRNFADCIRLKELVFPYSLKKADDGPHMSGCSSLRRLVIPAITDIPSSFASHAEVLEEVIIGDGVLTIGDGCFNGCSKLKSIEIGGNVRSIGNGFVPYDSVSLQKLSIPASVEVLGPGCIYSIGIKEVYIYSMDAELFDSDYTINNPDAVIYGYTGSTAEAYAAKYNRTFVSLDVQEEQNEQEMEEILQQPSPTRRVVVTIHWKNGEYADVTNDEICEESMVLEESICEDDTLRYGGCLANRFEIDVMSAQFLEVEPSGSIHVTMHTEKIQDGKVVKKTTPYNLFDGTIESAKRTRNLNVRKIIAYDDLYYKGNIDIISWYYRQTFPMTIGDFRKKMMAYVGIPTVATVLSNDAKLFPTNIKQDHLYVRDVLHDIAEVEARFGIMDRQGRFVFRRMEPNEGSLKGQAKKIKVYKDINFKEGKIYKIQHLQPVDYVGFFAEPTSAEESLEYYRIEDNVIFTMPDTKMDYNLDRLPRARQGQWRDYSVRQYDAVIPGNPRLTVGTNVEFTIKKTMLDGSEKTWTVNSYILFRKQKGIQSMLDSIGARNGPFTKSEGANDKILNYLKNNSMRAVSIAEGEPFDPASDAVAGTMYFLQGQVSTDHGIQSSRILLDGQYHTAVYDDKGAEVNKIMLGNEVAWEKLPDENGDFAFEYDGAMTFTITGNAIIYFSDGSNVAINSMTSTKITCPESACKVKIIGDILYLDFGHSKVTKILTPFPNTLLDKEHTVSACFSHCKSLTSVPENLFANCTEVTRFSNCFNECTSLTSIPENLFANCKEVLEFWACFDGCTGLTSIPENLFANCKKVTNFGGCFGFCENLTSVPENLFANCPEVTDFTACFSWCTSLTSIPENLFANCKKVTNFGGCFGFCEYLTSVPENLFANCPEVTDFLECFYRCASLMSVPENLFANCKKVTTFEDCFGFCTSLMSVPENLFVNCPEVTDFLECFYECKNILQAPKLWLLYDTASGFRCYSGCTSLPWYDEIPDDWK